MRRSNEAARADVGSAEATLRDAIVSVTAEVARNYCVLRGLQDQLAVAERNEVNQRQTLDLTQVRLDAGRGTQLDVSRAAAQLATTEATIPPLRISIATTIHRLSVLTGRQPDVLTPELSASRPMPALPGLNAIGGPEHCCAAGRMYGSQNAISPPRPRASVFRWLTCFPASRSSGRQVMTRHRGVMSARGLAKLFGRSEHHVGGVRSRQGAGAHSYRAAP